MTPQFLQPPCCWWFFSAPLCTAIRATRGKSCGGAEYIITSHLLECPYRVCARGRVLIVCEGRQVKKTRSKKVWIPRWKCVDLNQIEKTWTTKKSFNFKIQQFPRNKSYKVNVLSRAVTINRLIDLKRFKKKMRCFLKWSFVSGLWLQLNIGSAVVFHTGSVTHWCFLFFCFFWYPFILSFLYLYEYTNTTYTFKYFFF